MLAAGFIAGLLPLVHAHSFIAIMGVAAVLALINLKRWREWLLFFIVASVIAGPQLLWSTHGSAVSTRAFIAWEFGWGHGDEKHYLVLAKEYRRVHSAVDYRAALENRLISGLAETFVFLSAVYAVLHRSEFGEAGALDLGQRQDSLLLVDRFSATRRVAAGAALGRNYSARVCAAIFLSC